MKYPNIEAARARAGMSKTGLAHALGVNATTIQNWQSGKTPIKASKLHDLALLFGVTTDYLLGRTSSPTG